MQTTLYTPLYMSLLGIALATIAVCIFLLFIRKPPLNKHQQTNAWIVLLFALGLGLFTSGLWIGDRITPFVVVEPKSQAREPFWRLQDFAFEETLQDWAVDTNCAPASARLENDPLQANQGNGFLRLNAELQAPEAGQAISLNQMVCLKYEPAESWQLRLTDAVIAYIKVPASLDTIGNTFQAEFQVRSISGQDQHWSKARYILKVGEWTPIVWTRPSWLTVNTQELFFPPGVTGIWITMWSEKNFNGDILVDNIGLYMLQRP